MIQPLFFKTFARKLRQIFDAASGLPSPRNDWHGAAETIAMELVWDKYHSPAPTPGGDVFHHFLYELLHLYSPEHGHDLAHAIASSSAIVQALRQDADELDHEHAKSCLARFCPLFIDLEGGLAIGETWTLDALILDAVADHPKIWAVMRSRRTGNYRRLTWQVSCGPEDDCYLDDAYPVVSPELQMLFDGQLDETRDLTANLVLQPGSIAGFKARVENLA